MHWNYRILKTTEKETGEVYYGIHEYFYDVEDGKEGWTENPVEVISETAEGIRHVLERMMQALERPVVENTD